MDLDRLANLAEIASLLAILVAGAFALIQLRADRKARKESAAFAIMQRFMDDNDFIEAVHFLLQTDPGWHEHLSAEAQRHVDKVYMTLEIVGFAAYRGVVDLRDVEALMGGVSRQVWAVLEPIAEAERAVHPRGYEWTRWLVTSLEKARPGGADRPIVEA